jgi:dUTPase
MDLCADLMTTYACHPRTIFVPTGIAIALPHGFEAQIARAAIWLNKLTFVNSPEPLTRLSRRDPPDRDIWDKRRS